MDDNRASNSRFSFKYLRFYPPLISSKNSFKSSTKGQVSIFIIIGIVLLFAFAGVLFLVQKTSIDKLSAEGEPIISTVPAAFIPLKSFTEDCLAQSAETGLRLLGEQGGYIYPELRGSFAAINPTDNDGIFLDPLRIPYWHYNLQPNSAEEIEFASLKPSISKSEDQELSIESQLNRFVEENINECLDKYNSFLEQGFIIKKFSLDQVDTKVAEESVNLLLSVNLEVGLAEFEHDFNQFYVTIPLNLKKYYAAAEEIVQLEQDYSILEQQALELVQIYSSVDKEKLPPTSGVTFDFAPTIFWTVPEMKTTLIELLTINVPRIQFSGTENFFQYQYPLSDLSPLYQKVYDNNILPLLGGSGLEVRTDYFSWEPYLQANDANGVVEPSSLVVNYPPLNFGFQNYHTRYDLSYPVLITISDESALNGEGYNFVFALEANVRNNQPVVNKQKLGEKISLFSESMLCNPDQFTTKLISTKVIDSSTGNPLEAVQIGFSIPEIDNCIMGETNINGELEQSYPAVYGGVISYSKLGYLTNYYPVDTYKYKGQPGIAGYAVQGYPDKVIELDPIKTVKVSVKKKNLEKCIDGQCFFSDLFDSSSSSSKPIASFKPQFLDSSHLWKFSGVTKPLGVNEEVIFTLNRISNLNGLPGDRFSVVVSLKGGGITGNLAGGISSPFSTVDLFPGIYEVSGVLTLNERVIIPKEERCSEGIIFDIGSECFTLEELELNPLLSGQIQWNNEESYLIISADKLYPAFELELYIPSLNLRNVPLAEHLRVVEDLEVMGDLAEISAVPEVRSLLQPKFK